MNAIYLFVIFLFFIRCSVGCAIMGVAASYVIRIILVFIIRRMCFFCAFPICSFGVVIGSTGFVCSVTDSILAFSCEMIDAVF